MEIVFGYTKPQLFNEFHKIVTVLVDFVLVMFMYMLFDSFLPKTSFQSLNCPGPREDRFNVLPNYGDMKRKYIVIVFLPIVWNGVGLKQYHANSINLSIWIGVNSVSQISSIKRIRAP